MTTIATLEARVYFPLRDPDRDYVTEPEVLENINAAVRDLCDRERIYEVSEDLTVTAGHLPLPEGLLQVRWLQVGQDDVGWMNPDLFRSRIVDDPSRDQSSIIGTIIEDEIQLWPAVTGEITLTYYGMPADSVTGGTFPLKRTWEDKVVDYARAMAMYHLGEQEQGDRFLAQYEQGLRERPGNTTRRLPGKVNLAWQLGPMDRVPGSIHQG